MGNSLTRVSTSTPPLDSTIYNNSTMGDILTQIQDEMDMVLGSHAQRDDANTNLPSSSTKCPPLSAK
jgi:hypothetical protein